MQSLQTQFPNFIGAEAEPPRVARYAVNEAMIRHWVEAHDDRNPIYVDAEAARSTGRRDVVCPPAMISTWVMAGYRRYRQVQQLRADGVSEDFAYSRLLALLDEAGYTSVVATNVEQEYFAELSPGVHVTAHFTIRSDLAVQTDGSRSRVLHHSVQEVRRPGRKDAGRRAVFDCSGSNQMPRQIPSPKSRR